MSGNLLSRAAGLLAALVFTLSAGPLSAGPLDSAMDPGRGLVQAARALRTSAAPAPVPAKTGPRIVVIGVDKRTEEELGPFGPSYRPYNTLLIERMNEAGVLGAAFDIYFPEYPEWTDATEDLAEAAASGAPVVLAVYAAMRPGGVFIQKPNDPSIRKNPAIGQGSINFAYEVVTPGGGGPSSDGPVVVVAGSAGYEALVVELLRRVGVIEDGDLRRKGFVTRLNSAFGGKPLSLEVMHPALGEVEDGDITTVSFLDVLNGGEKEVLKDALVLIGVTDWEKDVFEDPDPVGAPRLKRLPGVYIHAALLRRILASKASPDDGSASADVPQGSAAYGLARDLEAAYRKAKEAKAARVLAQSAGATEARAFIAALDALTGLLERAETRMNEMVFSEEIDGLPPRELLALKERFTALYSIVPMPADYQMLVSPGDAALTERYESTLDSLSNLSAFSLDAAP